jgi:hypothetical protein
LPTWPAAGDPAALNVASTLDIAVKGGARNLGRDDIGELAPGFAADLVAWNVDNNLFCAGGWPGAAWAGGGRRHAVASARRPAALVRLRGGRWLCAAVRGGLLLLLLLRGLLLKGWLCGEPVAFASSSLAAAAGLHGKLCRRRQSPPTRAPAAPPPPGAVHQPVAALLMCMHGSVDMSVVNGARRTLPRAAAARPWLHPRRIPPNSK